jgi:hypothetical protein
MRVRCLPRCLPRISSNLATWRSSHVPNGHSEPVEMVLGSRRAGKRRGSARVRRSSPEASTPPPVIHSA